MATKPESARGPSPWLQVSARDYEGHMNLPEVDQLSFLARVFRGEVQRLQPARILLPGCAAGNGLDCLQGLKLERITAVDLQPDYLELARRRHAGALPTLELVLADLESWEPDSAAYDLVHCALVLEYLEPLPFIVRMARALAPGGLLCLLLQQPTAGHGPVSDSPFLGVRALEPIIRLREPGQVREWAAARELEFLEEERIVLPSGKAFVLQRHQRPETGSAL